MLGLAHMGIQQFTRPYAEQPVSAEWVTHISMFPPRSESSAPGYVRRYALIKVVSTYVECIGT